MLSEKIPTSVFILKEIKEHAQTNPHIKSISEWINEHYTAEFLSIESELKKKEELLHKLEEIEVNIQKVKEKCENIPIPEEALNWILKEGLQRLNNPGVDPYAVLRFFNNKFKLALTAHQFRVIVDRYKNLST